MRLLLSYLFLQTFFCFSLSKSSEINKNLLKKRCDFEGVLRVTLDLNEYEKNPKKFNYIYKVNEIEDDYLNLYTDKGYCNFLSNNYKKIGFLESGDDYYKLKEVIVSEDIYEKNIFDCISKDNIDIVRNNICILKEFPDTITTTSKSNTSNYFTTTPTTTNYTTMKTTTSTTTSNSTTSTTSTTSTMFPTETTNTNTSIIHNVLINSSKNVTSENFPSSNSSVITDTQKNSSQSYNRNDIIIAVSVSVTIVLIVIILFLVKYKRDNKRCTYKTDESTEETISENEESEYDAPNEGQLYLEPTPITPDVHINPIYDMDE